MVLTPMSPPPVKVRCRPIAEADLEKVADLLAQGFAERTRKYWTRGLDTLRRRRSPADCPQFGYLLEADGAVVGALLLIFSQVGEGDERQVRCNVSSWYVDPAFRCQATLLVSAATKLKHVTYLNISAAAHTRPIIEAQGYRRYSQGQFVAFPALSGGRGVKARLFDPDADRDLAEYDLVQAHVAAGCLAVVCETEAGATPFLFLRRRMAYAPFGVLQLVYCRDMEGYAEAAGAIGRLLLAQGGLAVLCDAAAPIDDLAGVFFKDKAPRYFKGPGRPRLNDLAFTELVMFGP
jgi:hypothetical protein